MFKFIAHAGEAHATSSESTAHVLESWYIALPLFLLVLAGIAATVYFVSKKSLSVTYLITVAILLIAGIFLYDKSAVVSVVSLTVGLFGSVVVVLASLARPKKTSNKKPTKK